MTHSRRWPASDTLDDLFVQHYGQMVARAQQLVGPDRQAAEDLVHDAYVRLALRRLDVSTVENFESYLHVTLRNVHLSQMRRRMSRVAATVSIIDYESVVAGLRSLASGDERQAAYDALCHVVRYACLRKASSKAASVLILRFFHGYYPGEIALVMQTSEAAIAGRLRLARAEARAYLADPDRVRFFDSGRALPRVDARVQGDVESVAMLRQAIFDASSGACLSTRALDHLYAGTTGSASDPLDATSLSHLVSCAKCLDTINRRLGLPLLADRDPSDRLGRGGAAGNGGAATGSGGGRTSDPAAMARTRLEDTREAQPQELQIAVNGLFVGAQAVYGPVNEQRLKILVSEPVGFIEVFDEHDTCLLYLDVQPPPSGAAEQAVRVTLSGGRHLSAALAFSDASPTIHVVYENPSPAYERQADVERAETLVEAIREAREGDDERSRPKWMFWPQAIRFVTVGILLGLLLANPRRTLAAVDYFSRGVADVVVRLLEQIRPRPTLPSRPAVRPGDVVPAPRVAPGTPFVRAGLPPASGHVGDIDMSELMLTTMRLLDDAGALTREQLRVERGADRRVHIVGGVENEARRRELRAALRVLPAELVRVRLATAGDAPQPGASLNAAAARAAAVKAASTDTLVSAAGASAFAGTPALTTELAASRLAPRSTPGTMRSAELRRASVPAAHEYVRRAIVARGPASGRDLVDGAEAGGAGVDDAARRWSAALLARSLSARVSAAALQQIVVSVPPADAARLSPAAIATWRELIRRHAAAFRHDTASLRGDLDRIFPASPTPVLSPLALPSPSPSPNAQPGASPARDDVWRIARRMFDLASVHDVAVRRAFAVAADGSESLDVSTAALRRSLLEAEQLAAWLESPPPPATP